MRYHRLHPEYIYTRIRNLQGKYTLRILLTMVDIPNHEDSLRELSKTSMVNNVTLILCWSAAEAARYVELYKSYEGASAAPIRGQQPSTYGARLVDFVTVPRSLNKSDAVALVANFGSLRGAVNAEPEQLGMIGGWGGVKVKRWTAAVEEPFRAKKAAKRGVQAAGGGAERTALLEQAVPLSRVPLRDMPSRSPAKGAGQSQPKQFQFLDDDADDDDDDDEAAMLAAAIEESKRMSQPKPQSQATSSTEQHQRSSHSGRDSEALSGGVAAALAKLREKGS